MTVSKETDVAAKELLAGLRAALDPDAERAGRKCLLLRRKLVSFFEWWGVDSPDARADETLLAVAWKLTDSAPPQNVPASCLAIARTILLTQQQAGAAPATAPATTTEEATTTLGTAAAEATPAAAATPAAPPAPATPAPAPFAELDLDALASAFENGLDALPDETRDIILTYYAGSQPHAMAAKEELANRLGLPLNQLRIRAHRSRSQLEQSVMVSR